MRDVNPFVGALGALSIRDLGHPLAQSIVERTRAYTISRMHPTGLWRYWPTLELDADSSSICNLLVGPHAVLVSGWYKKILLLHRNDEGLFHTWLAEQDTNDADAVVNANVVTCLGNIPETQSAQRWLERLIRSGEEANEIHYYMDAMELYNAITRAHRVHGSMFENILPSMKTRIANRRAEDGSYGDGLRTALAVSTLAQLGSPLSGRAAHRTIENLVDRQQEDGGWPDCSLSCGPFWPMERAFEFMSRAFDTAACLQALHYLRSSL